MDGQDGLNGAAGEKGFALVTNVSKREVAQIHFQILVVNIVKGKMLSKKVAQVQFFSKYIWLYKSYSM